MAKTEWTLATLKELLEGKIDALADTCQADKHLLTANAEHVADELAKQAKEYERRLSDLNHEAARINAANASNVSREVYDAEKVSNDEWKRRIEGLISNLVPTTEFRVYRDSTSKALTTAEGRTAGVGGMSQLIFQVIVALGALFAIILSAASFFSGSHTPSPAAVYSGAPVIAAPLAAKSQ